MERKLTTREHQITRKKKDMQQDNDVSGSTLPRIQRESAQDNVFESVESYNDGHRVRSSVSRSRASSYPSSSKKSTFLENDWFKYGTDVKQSKLKRASSEYKGAMNVSYTSKGPSFVFAPMRKDCERRDSGGIASDKYTNKNMPAIKDSESKLKLVDIIRMDLMNSKNVARMTGIRREHSMVLRNFTDKCTRKKPNVKFHLPLLKQSDNLSNCTKFVKSNQSDGEPSAYVNDLKLPDKLKHLEPKSEKCASNNVNKALLERLGKDVGTFIIKGAESKRGNCKRPKSAKEDVCNQLETVRLTKDEDIPTNGSNIPVIGNGIKSQSVVTEYTSILVNNDGFSEDTELNTDINGNKPRTVRFNINTHVREYEVDVESDVELETIDNS